MLIKEASKKWNISERRIRQLIKDGRLEAKKIGTTWEILDEEAKPIDKREKYNINYSLEIDDNCFKKIDDKLNKLKSISNMSKEAMIFLHDAINLEWTFNSNAIEGNTLTIKETKVVLEGITVGGKTIQEHLEAINHDRALQYLDVLIKENSDINEFTIKELHQLILKGINDEYAGKYRDCKVTISGATHIPPDNLLVPELMEKLIISYKNLKDVHPIVKSALLHGELVKIHPFIDGNGRVSRLLLNMSLMNDDYVPVIIKKDDRLKYYEALDEAHVTGDYTKFVKLIVQEENNMLDRYLQLLS